MHQQLTLPDGRLLDVVVHGGSGPAVVFSHGTPGAAEDFAPWVAAVQAAGLRWISVTRPGYGRSTRRPGRSVADHTDDVAVVLDTLGVERFAAMGWSGGGPHALACGARLTPRCAAVVTLAGIAPFDVAREVDFPWLDGMGEENHLEFGAAQKGESSLRAFLDPLRGHFVTITGTEIGASMGGLVGPADLAVLSGAFADDVARSFREAMRVGVDGWLDDDLAFVRPWGFDLADVTVPVSVWQGDDDRMVPYAHGPFLAERLPDAHTHLRAGEGHLSIPLAHFDEVLSEVIPLVQ